MFKRRNEVKRRMKHGTERKRMLDRLKERIRVNIRRDRQKRVVKYGQEIKDLLRKIGLRNHGMFQRDGTGSPRGHQ